MMVHSLLESSEDVSSRLAKLEERLARTAVPVADNVELESVFEGMSLITSTPAPNKYQQSVIEAQEASTAVSEVASEAASLMGPELDPHVQRLLQESRVYSRTLRRHSVSTIPWSYRSIGGWSMLSGITLAQISNISVLSIPITPSEVWGATHYENSSISQSFSSDRTFAKRRLRIQKPSETVPHRPVGISQGFRRLISPFMVGSPPRSEEAKRSLEIDRQLQSGPQISNLLLLGKLLVRSFGRSPSNTLKENAKLIVGTGESGKSTVLKQMKIILSEHAITWNERTEFRQILFSNMRVAFKTTCQEMSERGLGFSCQTSVVSATTIGWFKAAGRLKQYRIMQHCSTL